MSARAKRLAARTGAAVLIIVSVVVGLALLAIIALHSRWGRDYIRDEAVEAISNKFSAPVSIDEARVYLNGRVELDGVSIGGSTVDRLTAHVDLARAISGRIRISELTAGGASVDVLALVESFIPSDDPDAGIDLAIESMTVTDSDVTIGDLDVRVDRVTGSLRMMSLIDLTIGEFHGAVTLGDLTADVDTANTAAAARLVGDLLVVNGVDIASEGARADVHFGSFDVVTREAVALASVTATAGDARKIAGAFGKADVVAPLRGDATLPVVAAVLRSVDPMSGWAAVAGRSAGSPFWASADYAGDVLVPEIHTRSLNPASVWAGAPTARVNVDGSGRANLSSLELDQLEASANVVVSGAIEGEQIERSTIDVTAGAGKFVADVDARTGRGNGTAFADVNYADGNWQVVKLEVDAQDVDLAAIEVEGLRGRVASLAVDAKGPATKLAVSATATASGVGYDRASAKLVTASVGVTMNALALAEKKYPTSGSVSVTGKGVSYGGETLTQVGAKGDFSEAGNQLNLTVTATGHQYARSARAVVAISQSPSRTKVTFGDVAVTTTDVTWTGSGGEITVSRGRVKLSDIELASSAGKLAANGVVDEELVVSARDVDLTRIGRIANALFGVEIPVRGTVTATATIRDGGQRADVQGEFADLAYRETSNELDGDLTATLADGELTAVGHAREKSSEATATIDGAISAPLSVYDAAGWSRIGLSSVRRGVIDLKNISPALVSSITGKPLEVDGTADLLVRVDPGVTRIELDAVADNVTVGKMTMLGGSVHLDWDESGAELTIKTQRRRRPIAVIEARVEAPLSEAATRTPQAWKKTEFSGTVLVERFALSRLNRLELIREPLVGILDVRIALSGTIGQPAATIDRGEISRLRVAGAQVPRIEIGGRADLSTATGWIRMEQKKGGQLDASITTQWANAETTVLDLTSKKLDLRILRALATEPTHILAQSAGTLDARVHLEGDPREPVGKGSIRLRGGRLLLEGGARRLTNVALDARFDGTKIAVTRLSAQSGEGSVTASGEATLRNYIPQTFTLNAETRRFPYAAGDFAIGVDARARIDGDVRDGWVRARVAITDGTVELERSPRSLHETGDLEDVVFIDEIRLPGEKQKTGGIPPIELTITSKRPIRVKGKEVDVTVRPRLTVVFLDGALNSVRGRVWANRGWVALFERRYQIIVAEAEFTDNPRNPSIDVQLSRNFPIAEVNVHVYNDVEDPKVALSSDAGHAPAQVVSIMLGQDPEADEQGLKDTATGAGFGVGSLVVRSAAQRLPVKFDVVRLHQDGFEVGEWIFSDVLAGYRFRSEIEAKKNQHEGTLEWNILRRLVLEARYGNQAIGNADLLYIMRF